MRKLGTNKPLEHHSLTPKTKATLPVKSMHLLCSQKSVNVDTLNKYSDNCPKVMNKIVPRLQIIGIPARFPQ